MPRTLAHIACKCDMDYHIGEYLKDYTCRNSFVDGLMVTFDEIVDTPKTTSINPNDKQIIGLLLFY